MPLGSISFQCTLLLPHDRNIIWPAMSSGLSQDVLDKIDLIAHLQYALLCIKSAAGLADARILVTGDLALLKNQSIGRAVRVNTMFSSFLLCWPCC